MIIEQFLN